MPNQTRALPTRKIKYSNLINKLICVGSPLIFVVASLWFALCYWPAACLQHRCVIVIGKQMLPPTRTKYVSTQRRIIIS